MSAQERNTAQKLVIMDYLKNTKTHPTAEAVLIEVRKKVPCISQGTVYRVLGSFEQKGELQTIETKNAVHFDADTSDHAHFICEKCGSVYDVFDIRNELVKIKNKKTKVGKIKNYKINFYGICSKCKR